MKSLKETIMEREGLTEEEADELIDEAKDEIYFNGANPEDILHDFFALEPDYIFDLLD